MSKGRILVVEDDADVANLLQTNLIAWGYEVAATAYGREALPICREKAVHLIILDILLPDTNGFSVIQEIRSTTRTRHIPIIFLTQKYDRSDVIKGLELGADEYLIKPFDLEKLHLNIKSCLREISRLDGNRVEKVRLESYLTKLIVESKSNWSYIDFEVRDAPSFTIAYGHDAQFDVIFQVDRLIIEAVEQFGTKDDYGGFMGDFRFGLITYSKYVAEIIQTLTASFNSGVWQHYSPIDRGRGYMTLKEGENEKQVPFMTLTYGVVSSENKTFTDIREIVTSAVKNRGHRFPSTGEITGPFFDVW
jgi:CheY-like chemotaxis protein